MAVRDQGVRERADMDIVDLALSRPPGRRQVIRRLGLSLAAGVVLAGGAALLLPRTYTSTTTFTPATPASDKLPSSLATIAGQFGLGPGGTASQNPELFARILTSQVVLAEAIDTPVPQGPGGAPVPLIDVLADAGDDPAGRREDAVRALRQRVFVAVEPKTGIVTLSVELTNPDAAANVANRMVELLNDFNLKRMQSQSRAQRIFAGQQVERSEQDLQVAEDSLRRFLEQNRVTNAPLLELERARLERRVQQQLDVVLMLRREFEQAKVAEVRDTPVLTVIDTAVPARAATFPNWPAVFIIGLALGVVIFVVVRWRAGEPLGLPPFGGRRPGPTGASG